ncbi:MAG: hypothetical protein JNM70_03320 [Anaerolineae bacterium]|nr:hypothetical protein [Anaerolineae bacterium]
MFSLLLGLYLLVYTPRLNSIDGQAILAVSTTLVRDGRLDIGVIGAADALLPFDKARMGTFGQDGAWYSKKGITPSLALLPFAALAEALPWLDARAAAMWFNPLVTAATAVLLFTLARRIGYSARTAFVSGLLYGVMLPLPYTQTLYGEPLAALLMLAAVMAVWNRAAGRRALIGAGAALGLLFGINLVYGVFAMLFLGWIMLEAARRRDRLMDVFRDVLALLIPCGIALVGIGLYNAARFGSPLTTGYGFDTGEGFTTPLLTGLFGLTISPFRGLFWYSPALLLALPGGLMLRRRDGRLAALLLALCGVQLILFALWSSWEGGVVWGPRFLLPIVPLLALLLAPLIEAAWTRPGLLIVIAGLGLLSLAISLLGALVDIDVYFSLLFQQYASASGLTISGAILTDPAAFAALGHLALVGIGWPLEPSWLSGGIDFVHLAAVLAILLAGLWTRTRRGLIAFMLVVIAALNLTGWRQQDNEITAQIRQLEAAAPPGSSLLVASTHFSEALLDVEGRRVTSTNAPTAPGDRLARPMTDWALQQGGDLALLTWFPPASAENWQEQLLLDCCAFGGEDPAAGHRLLRFTTARAEPSQIAGFTFGGAVRLDRYGIERRGADVLVVLEWLAVGVERPALSWFAHVLDADGVILAQQDRPPLNGFAPTNTWEPGSSVTDRLWFPAVPGAATLRIGWVDPADGSLLPVTDAAGAALAEAFVMLPLDPK